MSNIPTSLVINNACLESGIKILHQKAALCEQNSINYSYLFMAQKFSHYLWTAVLQSAQQLIRHKVILKVLQQN
jgi:hypothetical protein